MSRILTSTVLGAVLVATVGWSASAQGPDSEAVGIGGRVEVPNAGYALTLPDDWTYLYPSAADAETMLSTAAELAPELATPIEAALAAGVEFSLVAFGEIDFELGFAENCNVLDVEAQGVSLEMAVAAEAAAARSFGELLAVEPAITMLELPAGDAARIDYGLRLPDYEVVNSVYYFTDGAVFHVLTCTGSQRPPDSWRSIAETFEFLPAEGAAVRD